jgi:hypothetical protein
MVVWEHKFDQQDDRCGIRRRANATQNPDSLIVRPVMDDVLEDVGVAITRDAVEKRPTGNAYAVCGRP